jgi:hypothetical protein
MTLNQKISGLLAALFAGNENAQGLPLSNRNYIVDGNFENWTVASVTMAVNSGGYSPATMYFANTGAGAGQATLSQVALSAIIPGLTTPARLCHRWLQTAAASASPGFLAQRVEYARTLSGQSATYSVWLWTNTGSNISINKVVCQRSFGTGGSPSPVEIYDVNVNWTVTPTPKRFSVRVDIPAVTSQVFGTNGNDFLIVGMYFPLGATFDLVTTQWQLEQSDKNSSSDLNGKGGAPTTFEYRGPQAELARVHRYYRAIQTSGASFNACVTDSTTMYAFGQVLGTPMRALPAGSLSAGWTGNTPTATITAISVVPITNDMWYMAGTSSGLTPGQAGYFGSPSGPGVVLDARL